MSEPMYVCCGEYAMPIWPVNKWVSISGYEGLYEISESGMVRSINRTVISKNGIPRCLLGKQLSLRKDSDGYLLCDLSKNGKLKTQKVHRLMAQSFFGKSDLVVDHINNIKHDNRISNLQYVTVRENTFKKYARSEDYYLEREKRKGYWRVTIKIGIKRKYVGMSKTKDGAIKIRDEFLNKNPQYKVDMDKVLKC